eukprot:4774592-Amphidinium_carterae.1
MSPKCREIADVGTGHWWSVRHRICLCHYDNDDPSCKLKILPLTLITRGAHIWMEYGKDDRVPYNVESRMPQHHYSRLANVFGIAYVTADAGLPRSRVNELIDVDTDSQRPTCGSIADDLRTFTLPRLRYNLEVTSVRDSARVALPDGNVRFARALAHFDYWSGRPISYDIVRSAAVQTFAVALSTERGDTDITTTRVVSKMA